MNDEFRAQVLDIAKGSYLPKRNVNVLFRACPEVMKIGSYLPKRNVNAKADVLIKLGNP